MRTGGSGRGARGSAADDDRQQKKEGWTHTWPKKPAECACCEVDDFSHQDSDRDPLGVPTVVQGVHGSPMVPRRPLDPTCLGHLSVKWAVHSTVQLSAPVGAEPVAYLAVLDQSSMNQGQ